MQKPSNAQGTRDFGPEVMRKRDFILQSIRRVFIKYGFEPIETPALENLSTLEGKYGEEGDKLLYKIRSNQDVRSRITDVEDLEKYDDLFNKSISFIFNIFYIFHFMLKHKWNWFCMNLCHD